MPSPRAKSIWDDDYKGRLGAPSGAASLPVGSSTGLPQTAGRLASYALSGQSSNPFSVAGVIKKTTGFETEKLPAILSKPIEYLGSPLGLAATIAAPLTGGASLAELGAAGIGTRLAASAATGVAGGFVGEEAGKLTQQGLNKLGAPDWLQTAGAIGVGLAAGAKTGAVAGRRLPAGIKVAGEHATAPLSTADKYDSVIQDLVTKRNTLNTRFTANPTDLILKAQLDAHDADIKLLQQEAASFDKGIPLPHIAEGLDPVHRAVNVVKGSLGKGVLGDKLGTPVVDHIRRGERTANAIGNEVRRDLTLRVQETPWLKYGEYSKGKATLIETGEGWKPFQDVSDAPRKYTLTSEQRAFIYEVSKMKRPFENQLSGLSGKQPRLRGSVSLREGGVQLPRGRAAEDGVNTLFPYTTDRTMAQSVGSKDLYTTMQEALDDGVVYPPLEQAMSEYVTGLSKASVEQHAVATLRGMRDADGNPLIRDAEDLLPQEIRDGHAKALQDHDYSQSSLDQLEEMQTATEAEVKALQTALGHINNPNIQTELDAASQKLAQIISTRQQEEQVFALAKGELNNQQFLKDSALRDLKYNPEFDTIKAFPQLQDAYGPKALTNSINSAFQPDGAIANAAKAAKTVNSQLRLFHTLLDISDYGRLFGTAGTTHPFDFFKGIQTGFRSAFNRNALGEDFRAINLELKANGIPYTMRDIIGHGNLSTGIPDIDLGVVSKLPGHAFIERTSNITQNGISSIRAHMVMTELVNLKKAGQEIGPQQLDEVTKGISLVTGSAIHRIPNNADLFVQFPNWLQSQFEFVTHGAAGLRPGASYESRYAAKALVKMVGLGLAATYTVNALGGHKTEYRNGVPMMRIGNTYVDTFGSYGALARGMYAALDGDVSSLLRSRSAPLFQIGWDLGTGRTQSGDSAEWDDPRYWGKVVSPYSFTGSNRSQGAEITILQGAGIRASSVSPFTQLREEAQRTTGKDWADLSGNEKEELRRDNPELVQKLEEQTKTKAEQGDPYAKTAIATQDINTKLIDQQASLNKLWQEGQISSVQLRDGLDTLNQAAASAKQQVRKDFGTNKSSDTPTKVQTALNQYYELYELADRGILTGGARSNLIDWEVFDKLEADLLAKLDPIQQKAITDRYVVRSSDLDWYYENKDLIRNSGYFEANQQVVDRMKPLLRAAAPGVETYNDLQQALNKAQREGNRGEALRLMALIERVQTQTQMIHKRATLTNPLLYKALVENGYLQQAKSQQLVANIQ